MIRVNLSPTRPHKKRRARASASAPGTAPATGQVWLLGMILGWGALAGGCYWLQTLEEDAANAARKKAGKINAQADAISAEIDEEALEQRQREVEEMKQAQKELNAKRRTPVYVLYELAMILTAVADGGGPDKDIEKYRRNLRKDSQSAINESWDPAGLWLDEVKQTGGVLALKGQARDAADLSEFVRRLRASARFDDVSNPDFQREAGTDKKTAETAGNLSWALSVQVARWN